MPQPRAVPVLVPVKGFGGYRDGFYHHKLTTLKDFHQVSLVRSNGGLWRLKRLNSTITADKWLQDGIGLPGATGTIVVLLFTRYSRRCTLQPQRAGRFC